MEFYAITNIEKEIRTKTIRLRKLSNGVIHYSFLPNAEVDIEQHIENNEALIELTAGTPAPILVDASELVNITPKAREKIKELEDVNVSLARAYVTKSLGHKLLIMIFMKINKPSIPQRVFSDYNEAMQWLMEVKDDMETKKERKAI